MTEPSALVGVAAFEPPPPTFTTQPGIASINNVYASDNCDPDHLTYDGELLDGIEGWDGPLLDGVEGWDA